MALVYSLKRRNRLSSSIVLSQVVIWFKLAGISVSVIPLETSPSRDCPGELLLPVSPAAA